MHYMLRIRIVLSIVLLCLLASCGNSSDASKEPETAQLKTAAFGKTYSVNPFTSLKTELPKDSPASGKLIDLDCFVIKTDTMPAAETIALKAPVATPANSGIYTFTPGKPLANQWLPKGKIRSATKTIRIPKGERVDPVITKAAPPFFRDNALLDLRYIDVDQGLKSSYVRSILAQSDGHIWIGLFDGGLCRYDGFQYEHYGAPLDLHTASTLTEDNDGNIWISNWNEGLYCYDGFRFRDYRFICKEKKEEVVSVRKTAKGVVVSTLGNNLYFVEGTKLTSMNVAHLLTEGEYLTAVEVDKKGEIWIVTDRSCFRIAPNGNVLQLAPIGSEWFYNGTIESDGALWLAGSKGAVRLTENGHTKLTTANGLISEDITSLRKFADGKLYLATLHGLQYIDGNQLRLIQTTSGLTNDVVIEIRDDGHGNAWIGTNGGGVCIYRPSSFEHYTDQNGLPSHLMKTIQMEPGNELWMGAYPGDLVHLKGDRFLHYNEVGPHIGYPVFALAKDRQGGIWFNQWGEGLYHMLDGKMRIYTEETGVLSTRVRIMAFDRNGNLWLGTTSGLCKIEHPGQSGERIRHYSERLGYLNNGITDIKMDSKGGMWVAAEGGLTHFPDPAKDRAIHYTEKEGLPIRLLTCLNFHGDELWFGTDGAGFCRLKDGRLTSFREENGLSSDKVFGISIDERNRKWISTSNGVNVLLPNDRIITFGKTDGLKGTDFYRGSNCIDLQQRLWLGSGKALTRLDLKKWKLSSEKPEVFLKSVGVNGKPVELPQKNAALRRFERRPEKLDVVYRNNHISFLFSAIDWSSAGRLEFSFRVKDLTDSWSSWSTNNFADFRNISPGSYTFEVRARNKFGVISETERFGFTVAPPWWMTWWAFVLFILCLLGLMLAILRWRTGRLKRRQRELETIVDERTEELKEQTQRVIEKNNEIMDSIAYAKRIQDAILPNAATVAALLPNAFIVYRPKDIVAGDFYWMKEHNGTTYFAVADCTGHGVPGALVSVVCNNALNKALEDHSNLMPGKILDRTREIVIDAFTKSGQDVKDGMDISLCAWNKAAGTIHWAGANNPLWIIRKGELLEWKGDKQPIGKYDYAVPFTTHEIAVEKDDLLLLFTDGFQDQFGGEKKKKLKIVGWKAVLMELAEVPEENAEEFIRSWFETWKDNEEQLDDVCLMGLRIV